MYHFHCWQKAVKRVGKPQTGKGKKKKITLKYSIDCTHPVEDGIMDVANFVSFWNYCKMENFFKLLSKTLVVVKTWNSHFSAYILFIDQW